MLPSTELDVIGNLQAACKIFPFSARHQKITAQALLQVTASLAAVVPEDLQPVTDAGRSSSWLSFSDAGRAATDLRLYVGSSFWTSGFSKHPAGLRPVYFSVQQGSRLKVCNND